MYPQTICIKLIYWLIYDLQSEEGTALASSLHSVISFLKDLFLRAGASNSVKDFSSKPLSVQNSLHFMGFCLTSKCFFSNETRRSDTALMKLCAGHVDWNAVMAFIGGHPRDQGINCAAVAWKHRRHFAQGREGSVSPVSLVLHVFCMFASYTTNETRGMIVNYWYTIFQTIIQFLFRVRVRNEIK